MSREVYLLLFLIALHVFWLSVVVDVNKKVLITGYSIIISIIIYILCPILWKTGLMIQGIFYLAGLLSIYYIKEDK